MLRRHVFAPLLLLAACRSPFTAVADANASGGAAMTKVGTDPGHAGDGTPLVPAPGHALAAFAEGCFWGSEDTFRHVPGVVATAVGYTGGHTDHPTYEDVCSHTTGHAEVVEVSYDDEAISYDDLLNVFWRKHDPTQLNRQGWDIGDNYRTVVFVHDEEQRAAAERSKENEQAGHKQPIVTTIEPAQVFYEAEDYHQQYLEKRGLASCTPRLAGVA